MRVCLSSASGDHPGRVGKVKQPGLRTEFFHLVGNFQRNRNGPAGVGKAAEAIGLLTNQTVLERDALITDTRFQTTCPELRADKVGILQCRTTIQGFMHRNPQTGLGQHPPGQVGDDLHLLLPVRDIHQPQLAQR